MSYIVTEKWLKENLENDLENTIVIDTRFDLTNPNYGREAYEKGHIPYAYYFDLFKDLASEPKKHGGRNPLPNIETFTQKLGQAGITHDKSVVIYDQAEGMYASRAWWLLHYLGHEKVYILDGGFKAWTDAGNDITDEIREREHTSFQPKILEDIIVHMEEVKEKIENRSAILLDARSKDRYLGKNETIDPKAGHIPGAKNYFWKNVLQEDGTWKELEDLEKNFRNLSKNDEIIVSCGSGVSACPNIVALKMLGYNNIKLYPGSFSDWISYEGNRIETKEE